MPLPGDYVERVYAGVLGKIIGVYLGRPFEGWTYERIMAELGEINYYVHERLGMPLIVTDDDISGTFTFLRALPDHGNDPRSHPGADRPDLAQLHHRAADDPLVGRHGQLHRAHRLSAAQAAASRRRASGSIALNGKVVAEQIGAQIFIDGWAHGRARRSGARRRSGAPRRQRQPRRRGDLRRAGARGDGGAGVRRVATSTGCSTSASRFIPRDSIIARLIARHARVARRASRDWRATRARIAAHYGYDKLRRQLPHGAQPRADHPRPALRRRTTSSGR